MGFGIGRGLESWSSFPLPGTVPESHASQLASRLRLQTRFGQDGCGIVHEESGRLRLRLRCHRRRAVVVAVGAVKTSSSIIHEDAERLRLRLRCHRRRAVDVAAGAVKSSSLSSP